MEIVKKIRANLPYNLFSSYFQVLFNQLNYLSMKKQFIFAMASFFLLLFGCSKSNNKDVITTSGIVEKVLKIKSQEELKLTYNLLVPSEKKAFWENRVSLLIKSKNYTKKQLVVIEDLLSSLSVDLFENKSKSKEIVEKLSVTWFAKASLHFNSKQIAELTILTPFIVSNGGEIEMLVDDGGEEDNNKCKCKSDAVINHCDLYSNTCVKDKDRCTHTDIGCGFLGLSSCDGRCTNLI